MRCILTILILIPFISFGQRQVNTIRTEDLAGVENYTIIIDTFGYVPMNEKMGMQHNECDGWIEYFYVVDNDSNGVKLILDELSTLLDRNDRDINKPQVDASRYMYLAKDSTTNEYNYNTISDNCSSKGGLTGQYILMEWRVTASNSEWAIRLQIKGNLAMILTARRDIHEKDCY